MLSLAGSPTNLPEVPVQSIGQAYLLLTSAEWELWHGLIQLL